MADKSFITFDVVTWLKEGSAATTEMEIRVQARAVRRDNASGQLICSSEGNLEEEIYKRVALRMTSG